MSQNLHGRVGIVTGASSGIGLSIANTLAEREQLYMLSAVPGGLRRNPRLFLKASRTWGRILPILPPWKNLFAIFPSMDWIF